MTTIDDQRSSNPKGAARELGASAHENRERWDADNREDIAFHYGHDSWKDMTKDQQSEAKAAWKEGWRANAQAHGEIP